MQNDALRHFLVEANRAGYAGGDQRTWCKQADGSTTILYQRGDWLLNDNFFGGEPYGGRAVVFQDGKPAWMMVYYGWVAGGCEADLVYGVLRKALMQMPDDCPLRGPREHRDGGYTYSNAWNGDVERFTGVEQITRGPAMVYQAIYCGGVVDQRRGA